MLQQLQKWVSRAQWCMEISGKSKISGQSSPGTENKARSTLGTWFFSDQSCSILYHDSLELSCNSKHGFLEQSNNSKHGCLECSSNLKHGYKELFGQSKNDSSGCSRSWKNLCSLYFGVNLVLLALIFIEPGALEVLIFTVIRVLHSLYFSDQSAALSLLW